MISPAVKELGLDIAGAERPVYLFNILMSLSLEWQQIKRWQKQLTLPRRVYRAHPSNLRATASGIKWQLAASVNTVEL